MDANIIYKSDGSGELTILPEVKALSIAWIENYVPNGSPYPEIAQKWKLAEDIQRIIDSQRQQVRREAISDIEMLIEIHWRFDRYQQHLSSWHDKQDLIEALEKLKDK